MAIHSQDHPLEVQRWREATLTIIARQGCAKAINGECRKRVREWLGRCSPEPSCARERRTNGRPRYPNRLASAPSLAVMTEGMEKMPKTITPSGNRLPGP